jgi:hypothetical protein
MSKDEKCQPPLLLPTGSGTRIPANAPAGKAAFTRRFPASSSTCAAGQNVSSRRIPHLLGRSTEMGQDGIGATHRQP